MPAYISQTFLQDSIVTLARKNISWEIKNDNSLYKWCWITVKLLPCYTSGHQSRVLLDISDTMQLRAILHPLYKEVPAFSEYFSRFIECSSNNSGMAFRRH